MGAFKGVFATFVKISLLISCGVLASAPAAAFVGTWRFPHDGGLFDIIEEKDLCDRYTFDTYDEAAAAIADWNYYHLESYRDALTAWGEECEEIASDVEAAVTYKPLGKAVVISPEKRSLSAGGESTVWVEHDGRRARVTFNSEQETTAWLKRGVAVVERIVPAYKFPKRPRPGEPYDKARSAYSQIHTDGLTLYEWRVLRFALCDTNYLRERRSLPSYFRGEHKPLERLVDERYVTVNAREKRNFWEAAAGDLDPKLDFKFTAAGKEYLHTLADRCCDFRERMSEEARDLGEITAAEYERLHKDNEYVRTSFHKQIDRTSNWEENLPYKLEVALKSFEIRAEGVLEPPCPYTRVIKCMPEYKRAPRAVQPQILPAGTYVYDARGELKAVNLD
jgi:hypothetical protein